MANENSGAHRIQPVRIMKMSIAPGDPRPSVADPLVIVAELDPAPDREDQQWWIEQLRARVKVRGWGGSPAGLTSVNVEAPTDQVEAVARRLLTAVEEANAAYSERYPAWRREHDARIAEEQLRQQRRFAALQAILDRVMDEHRSNQ